MYENEILELIDWLIIWSEDCLGSQRLLSWRDNWLIDCNLIHRWLIDWWIAYWLIDWLILEDSGGFSTSVDMTIKGSDVITDWLMVDWLIVAEDSGGFSTSVELTIKVSDVNDNAPKFELPDYQAGSTTFNS